MRVEYYDFSLSCVRSKPAELELDRFFLGESFLGIALFFFDIISNLRSASPGIAASAVGKVHTQA